MTQEALKLALEAMEVATTPLAKDRQEVLRAITAIKEALAQTQEPKIKTIDPFESSRVADYNRGWNDCLFASGIVKQPEQEPKIGCVNHDCDKCKAQRTWVGLTDEDICTFSMWLDDKSDVAVFTAIEAKLKEKNT